MRDGLCNIILVSHGANLTFLRSGDIDDILSSTSNFDISESSEAIESVLCGGFKLCRATR